MNEKTTPEELIRPNPNRSLFIGLGIAAGTIILIFILVAIVFVLLDPFNIVARLTGRYDPIASALPLDSPFILSMDFAKLQSKESKRIIEVFKDAVEAADVEDTADLIEELDDSLSESLDITFTNDILPWVGQFAGMSMPSFDMDFYGMPAADVIFLVEVRNRRKADDFIQKIVNNLTEDMDQEINQTEYRGATIYDAQGAYEFDSFVFTRFDNLLLISTDVELIKDSIDASKGDSYADTEKYDEIISSLPKERVITMLFDSNLISSLQEDLLEGLNEFQQVDLFRWIGASISAVDSGIQMDFVIAYDEENLTEDQLVMMERELHESTLAPYFPQETFFYFAGQRLDLIWETLRENSYQLIGTDQDTIGEIYSRSETLLDNERYKQSWEALPDGTHPVLFFDLTTLYEILEDEFLVLDDADALSSLDIFRPMYSIVAGSAPMDEGVVRSTIILLIEGGE